MGSGLEQEMGPEFSMLRGWSRSFPALSIRSVRGSNPQPLIDDATMMAVGSRRAILWPWTDVQRTGV